MILVVNKLLFCVFPNFVLFILALIITLVNFGFKEIRVRLTTNPNIELYNRFLLFHGSPKNINIVAERCFIILFLY